MRGKETCQDEGPTRGNMIAFAAHGRLLREAKADHTTGTETERATVPRAMTVEAGVQAEVGGEVGVEASGGTDHHTMEGHQAERSSWRGLMLDMVEEDVGHPTQKEIELQEHISYH